MKKQLFLSKKTRHSLMSLLLVLTLIITGLNLDVMSQSIYAAKRIEKENSAEQKNKKQNNRKEATVVKELTDERTENTNTYLMSDGTKKLEISSQDIRYRENGRWHEYNTELEKTSNNRKEIKGEYLYTNKQGKYKQYFPEKLDDNAVVMTNDDYEIRVSPILEDEYTYELNNADINDEDNSEISYTDDSGKIEYEYLSLTNGVKESVVLNEKPENNVFEFELNLSNLILEYVESTKEIKLLDADTEKEKATIAEPNLIDANGEVNYKDVKYEIKEKEDGTYKLLLVVDEKYLEKAAYPVKIDPTYYWGKDSMWHWRATMSVAPALSPAETALIMNSSTNKGRFYVKIDGLSDMLKGKYVYESSFLCTPRTVTRNPEVNVSAVTEDWEYIGTSWATQPDISAAYDKQSDFAEGRWKAFILTDWANDIASGNITNYGLAFWSTQDETIPMIQIYTPLNNINPPALYVYYEDIENVNAEYDGSLEVQSNVNDDNDIELTWNIESEDIKEYFVCLRTGEHFVNIGKTEKTSYTVPKSELGENTDIRIMAVEECSNASYLRAKKYLSNIVSFQKNTETVTGQDGVSTTKVTYEETVFDIDGDGLEDGYEIWDFKTLWNTETTGSTSENPVYNLDTDDDGFPDSYEVFILGTDPAIANPVYDEEGYEYDSDGDGVSDIAEYKNEHETDSDHPNKVGTDPWLWDSDFDGISDGADFGDTEPRKPDNIDVKGTDREEAYGAQVHKGLYDREYTETDNGVSTTYISNIYNGQIKSIYTDYGDGTENKRIKYFYDEYGNNTAVVEENPNQPKFTVCIVYTYDKEGNVRFICDQSTLYEMEYKNGNLTEVKVGNQSLVSYESNVTEIEEDETTGGEETTTSVEDATNAESERKKQRIAEDITIYGKNSSDQEDEQSQKIKTVTTDYKEKDGTDGEMMQKTEIYYDDTLAYVTELNSDGKILNFTDKTKEDEVTYTYTYTDTTTRVARNDGFIKELISEDEDNKLKLTTNYTFKNLKGDEVTYTSVSQTDTTDEKNVKASVKLYNEDIVNSGVTNEGKDSVTELYSAIYKKNVYISAVKENDNTHTTLSLDLYAEDKDIDYVYNNAGNITEIKINEETAYKYQYDIHGRLTQELDYITDTGWTYDYSNTGNVKAKHSKEIWDDGTIHNVKDIKYTYENPEWPDQLTKYNGNIITYDRIGNPLSYRNKMEFTWSRGRQLTEAIVGSKTEEKDDDKVVNYEYNENGLRTYKEVRDTSGSVPVVTDTVKYEWDETNLIRETVTYGVSGKQYDIWYLYDSGNNVIGFEYSQLSDMDYSLKKTRIYYEKNLQGDVIGLLDSRGAEIAKYAYDAWGNVVKTGTFCYEGYETPYMLNHIRYRSYYQDDETGFYYLQSRYYDAEVGRFINADDVSVLALENTNVYKDNLYCYCNNNPLNYIDPNGMLPLWMKITIGIVGITVAVIATIASGGSALPALISTLKFVAGNIAISMAIEGVIGYLTGGTIGLKQGLLDGATDGFMWGGIGSAISSVSKAIKIFKTGKAVSAACFEENTLITTEYGMKPIKDIQVGDRIYTFDVDTGHSCLSVVKRVYLNVSSEVVNIQVNNINIIATKEHPFWVENLGWKGAQDLREEMQLKTENESVCLVKKVIIEQLDEPIIVYNLEIDKNHNYYVSEQSILVHNMCAGFNNYRTLNETTIKGYRVSMDLERGGSGLMNIHLKINNTKYFWNGSQFVSSAGKKIPNSLKGNTMINKALKKALMAISQKKF